MGLKSLEETTKFIEEQWNEEIVEAFLERIDERIEQVKLNPSIAPTYKNTVFRQLTIHSLVTLYYAVDEEHVYIVLVWANKQDPDELEKRLETDVNMR